jgi:DNA-binding MarR family transcriptional regulator
LTVSVTSSFVAPRSRPPYAFPLLLAAAFRAIVDELHTELAERGHPEARPLHGFALQAIGSNGATISDLARRLGVSKQAAAKTAAALERVGYVGRTADQSDARAVRLERTASGEEMLALSAAIFADIHRGWERTLGRARLRDLEDALSRITAGEPVRLDLPGWLS